jgi:hypothetical protein
MEIMQVDVGATTFTISQPGFYVFGENIVFSPVGSGQPAIEITSDNVTIDMCGKILSQGNAVTGVNGFRIVGGAAGTPRTNVTIMNGGISGFTRAGVVVGTNPTTAANTAAQLITLKNLGVVNCALRGIEFIGTSAAPITKSIVESCLITLCCTGASADNALRLEFTQCINVNNCEISNNGTTSINFIGMNILSSTQIDVNFVDIECNTVQSFTGFSVNASNDCLLSSCRVVTNSSVNALTGFVIQGGISVAGNILTSCLTANNQSTNGPLAAFELLPLVTRNIVQSCKASNNSTTNSGSAARCIGFSFDQTTSCCVNESIACNNRASSTTNFCAGFNIGTSGGAGTGVKSCEFYANRAEKNNALTDALSFGIRAISTAGGNVGNVYILNMGVRNGPTTPILAQQIVSTAGAGSSPGGVPSLSIRSTSFTMLNAGAAAQVGISNVRID